MIGATTSCAIVSDVLGLRTCRSERPNTRGIDRRMETLVKPSELASQEDMFGVAGDLLPQVCGRRRHAQRIGSRSTVRDRPRRGSDVANSAWVRRAYSLHCVARRRWFSREVDLWRPRTRYIFFLQGEPQVWRREIN